jgi:quercetin 2,3-dioxygenase
MLRVANKKMHGAKSHRGDHESIIGAGGVQWMTAGSGLVHAELSPSSFTEATFPRLVQILPGWSTPLL